MAESEVWFRHADRRVPFLRSGPKQPAARWHGPGDGPANYLADTPDGAWAEFLRHEAITDPSDLAGISRRLWAIEVPRARVDAAAQPEVPFGHALGGLDSYPACQEEARRLRAAGHDALLAPSAALLPGTAGGQAIDSDGITEGEARDGRVLVLFGSAFDGMRGWACNDGGGPADRVLALVRSLDASTSPAR